MINSLIQNEDKLYFKVVMTHDVSSLCARNIISRIQKICFYMFHTSAFAWYQNCFSKNKFLWFTWKIRIHASGRKRFPKYRSSKGRPEIDESIDRSMICSCVLCLQESAWSQPGGHVGVWASAFFQRHSSSVSSSSLDPSCAQVCCCVCVLYFYYFVLKIWSLMVSGACQTPANETLLNFKALSHVFISPKQSSSRLVPVDIGLAISASWGLSPVVALGTTNGT